MKTRKATAAQVAEFQQLTAPIYAEIATAIQTSPEVDVARYDAAAQRLTEVCNEHGFFLGKSSVRVVA